MKPDPTGAEGAEGWRAGQGAPPTLSQARSRPKLSLQPWSRPALRLRPPPHPYIRFHGSDVLK